MTVEPRVGRPSSQLGDYIGFWLWTLVGAGLVLGLISFIVFLLILPVALLVVLIRWSRWKRGPVLLGMVAGAGLPLLVVAGVQWNAWHDRTVGDLTPNPYDWGGIGLCLLGGGIASYEVFRRRTG